MKPNPMLAKIETKIEAKYKAKFDSQMHMAMQLICDAAFLAANRMFHMGPSRAFEYREIQEEELKWIVGLMMEDQKEEFDDLPGTSDLTVGEIANVLCTTQKSASNAICAIKAKTGYIVPYVKSVGGRKK